MFRTIKDKWQNSDINGIDVNMAMFPDVFRCTKCGNILKCENVSIKYSANTTDELTGTVYPCKDDNCHIMDTLANSKSIDLAERNNRFTVPTTWRNIKLEFTAVLDIQDTVYFTDMNVTTYAD